MILAKNKKAIPFVVEESAFEGVKRVAKKVAEDVEKISGALPAIVETVEDAAGDTVVFAATAGCSALADELIEAGKLDVKDVDGKREVYTVKIVEEPFEGVEKALVVYGSDKLGTIYGLFHISEYMGVSPMCYWGDSEPQCKAKIRVGKDIEETSKEPSVKFRGLFINDEWPCYGNWTFEHFGGFTAEMYDHVFELLLRMKANYMWPAMWSSSFPLDGPGCLNEELADIYGITIGYSHHEPCLRASEEWDIVRGEDSPYGNEWNYYTNSEGLTRYWADALKRSGKYNHLVTIGMRGERDSSMLGDDATLKDNIELLKDIILKQRSLIREHVNPDVDSVPQILALYKEVEAYFYGDENTPGLKEWDELENVIFMLCEDNFGHMRTLPTEEMRAHKGGFGMYYHFDYHGGPVSFEWMPSVTMALTWEQMTQAYDYGIKDVWVVNVGDLKGHEVDLGYFLAMAYDFEKWGTSAVNSWETYMKEWARMTFPNQSESFCEAAANLHVDFVNVNAMRRPEALHAGIYHPCHFNEIDRMLALADSIDEKNEALYKVLEGKEKDAYYSMLYYPAKISMNLLRMQLCAGKNAHYAAQGRKAANEYAIMVTKALREDKRLCKEFAKFKGGKWKGMELEKHIGFTQWNDFGWKNPIRMYVEPVTEPRLSVSRADESEIAVKRYGAPMSILVDDFLYEGTDEVIIELSNDGVDSLHYQIEVVGGKGVPNWLRVPAMKGEVHDLLDLTIGCNREYLPDEEECVRLMVGDGDTKVAIDIKGKKTATEGLAPMTFTGNKDYIAMEAFHYSDKHDTDKAGFIQLNQYGRSGCGMKVMPSTADFAEGQDAPSLTYSFVIPESGDYTVELWTSPTNSVVAGRPLRVQVGNGSETKVLTLVDTAFRAGDTRDKDWCRGALDQIRVTPAKFTFEKGVQTLTVSALEAGMVLERVLIHPADKDLKESYLGPQESYFVVGE